MALSSCERKVSDICPPAPTRRSIVNAPPLFPFLLFPSLLSHYREFEALTHSSFSAADSYSLANVALNLFRSFISIYYIIWPGWYVRVIGFVAFRARSFVFGHDLMPGKTGIARLWTRFQPTPFKVFFHGAERFRNWTATCSFLGWVPLAQCFLLFPSLRVMMKYHECVFILTHFLSFLPSYSMRVASMIYIVPIAWYKDKNSLHFPHLYLKVRKTEKTRALLKSSVILFVSLSQSGQTRVK